MKSPRFKYVRPNSLDEAIGLLSEFGDEARVLAGGQSLMPTLNMRLSHPEILIDINNLEDLKGISLQGDFVRIGALVRHVEVMESSVIREELPLIAEAIPYVAHVAIRNRGTFGGSIALADPAAEMPACALALNANFLLKGPRGTREIEAEKFFYGLYETAIEPDEILVAALLPRIKSGEIFAFTELARRQGDFAQAGVACKARISGQIIEQIRLVYFGSEVKPTLGNNMMTVLKGQRWSDSLVESNSSQLDTDLDPIQNLHGSSSLKLHLQKVLTKRVVHAVMEKAGSI